MAQPMLDKLRRKFIVVNMAFVVAVMAVVVIAVSAVNYNQRVREVYDSLSVRMSMSMGAGFGVKQFPEGMVLGDLAGGDAGTLDQRESSEEQMVATSDYLVSDTGTVTMMGDALDLDATTLSQAIVEAQSALTASGGDFAQGHIADLNLYYQAQPVDAGTRVVVASGNYVDQTMLSLLATLLAVCGVALAAFFAMSVFLARWALRPVEQAWERQQQFIADASHELKTPLTVILANDSILQQQPDATVASQMQWVESTDTEARLMQGLVNDMLELARTDASGKGREKLCCPVDLSDAVERVALQFESVAFERGIRLDAQVGKGIHVAGDATRLSRLASTLLDNACKYAGQDGAVGLSLSRDGAGCVLRVANSGPAIAAADLPHVFDRFYRADKARTSGSGGYGLGLAIAKGIAEEHGGTISVASTEEDGTTFTVRLPMTEPSA